MRFHGLGRFAGLAGLLAWAGCAPGVRALAPQPTGAGGLGGPMHVASPADPTVRGARFVPIASPHDVLGEEPGGGVRAIQNGVRVVSFPGGAMLAAEDRFEAPPSQVLVLPERLGGGFLFVVGGTTVWRAERWLGPARVLYVASSRIGRVVAGRALPALVAGLDRVYFQTEHEVWHAIDGERGTELPLGPWPSSPNVGWYAAADGWRAIATADLRGTIATFDAGATWRPLHVPPDEREARLLADADLTPAPTHASESPRGGGGPVAPSAAPSTDGAGGPLGARPLAAVVEDGWPLDDGTAIVARDGVLARVRTEDGAIQSLDPTAYPLRPSRCHAIPLGPQGGVGFSCGEPRGSTVLYVFDPALGRMIEDRRFDAPRLVLASGNGAVSVRGPCDARAPADVPGSRAYCIRGRDGQWRETRLTGALGDAPGDGGIVRGGAERVSAPVREHVIALADGRLALVWPPSDLAGARLMLIDGAAVRSIPIAFHDIGPDVRRALEDGLWLDGFEERRPGVVGGWIASGGSMLGIEIGLDGGARFGAYVHDAGARIVSGRYGLGWTRGRVSLETTDGGMTWAPIDGPAPIDETPATAACGPIGCEVAGWLRVGWHEARRSTEIASPPTRIARDALPRVRAPVALACEGVATKPRGRDPLSALPIPTTTSDESRYTFHAGDLRDSRDVDPRTATLGRVYAWGPRGGEWDRSARWIVQWASPFAGADESHATIASPAPTLFSSLERVGASTAPQWTIAAGDDAAHALLLAQGGGHDPAALAVFELEADRTPVAIRAPDDDPFGKVDAALRVDGRWYLASHVQPAEAIVWRVEGPSAREVARLPRWFDRGRSGAPAPRLAWRTDGRALGFVVDGGPTANIRGSSRWVAPIDLETGAVGEVELLGAADLGDAETLTVCAPDDVGWALDSPLPSNLAVDGAGAPALLSGVLAHLRLDRLHPCLERLAGRLSVAEAAQPRSRIIPRTTEEGHPTGGSVSVTATREDERDPRSLRCTLRSAAQRDAAR